MAAMGENGMTQAARLCVSKAHYLQKVLDQAGLRPKYDVPFFHEFVTVAQGRTNDVLKALEEKGILGGYPLNEDEILWCATEKSSKETMDQVALIVKEVCGS